MYCSGGKVHLPPLQPYPEHLYTAFSPTSIQWQSTFFPAVRKYDGCFQMSSFGATEVEEGNFMPTFKVQGQVYHQIGSIMEGSQQQPSFLQIHFVGDDDKDIHCGIYPGVNPQVVSQLQKLLHEQNKYILELKAVVDSVPKGHKDFQVVININRKPSGEHRGRFNAPMTTEVAVLIVGQDFEKRDIALHSRDNRLLRISETHCAYDILQYPLMFCHGENGYYINIPHCDPNTKVSLKKTVPAAAFYSYRIMECDGEECYLLLFQFHSEAWTSNRLVLHIPEYSHLLYTHGHLMSMVHCFWWGSCN